MTEQTKGFTELVKNPVADAVALLTHYSFDLSSQTAVELVDEWLTEYSPAWIHLAVVEALYQGRYKAVSVEQILALWQRRGQPLQHFTHEFERLVCHKLPRTLTTIPKADSEDDVQNAAIATFLRNLHRDITTQSTTEDNDVVNPATSEAAVTDSVPATLMATPGSAEIPASDVPGVPIANEPSLPVLPSSAATVANPASTDLEPSLPETATQPESIAPFTSPTTEAEILEETATNTAASQPKTTAPSHSEVPSEALPSTQPQHNPPLQTSNYPGLAELVESARQEILDSKPIHPSPDPDGAHLSNAIDNLQTNSSADLLPTKSVENSSQTVAHAAIKSGFGLQSAIDATDLLKPIANHDPINQFTPVPESSEFYTKLRAVAHVDEQGTPLF
jgi:hypothetical protein